MRYSLSEVVKTQRDEVDNEFSELDSIRDSMDQLALPVLERENQESDVEIAGWIEDSKDNIEKSKNIHETPIPLDRCILPQLALVRIKETDRQSMHYVGDDVKHNFILIGEVMQAPGHVILSSVNSGKIHSMIHSDYLEVVPPQSC